MLFFYGYFHLFHATIIFDVLFDNFFLIIFEQFVKTFLTTFLALGGLLLRQLFGDNFLMILPFFNAILTWQALGSKYLQSVYYYKEN